MENSQNLVDKLNTFQSQIASLFEGVLEEKNKYKKSNEYLGLSLKQMSCKVNNLKKQNEELRLNITDLKKMFSLAIKAFKELDLSNINFSQGNKLSLEILKNLFLETALKIQTPYEADVALASNKEEWKDLVYASGLGTVKQERIGDFNFSKFNSTELLPIKLEADANFQEGKCGSVNEHYGDASRQCRTPERVSDASVRQVSPKVSGPERSPVFKDFGGRRNDSGQFEDDSKNCPTPFQLINEKFVQKSTQFTSPLKSSLQKTEDAKKKGKLTPKRTKNNGRFNSPAKSPNVLLKKSNLKEAEISPSGAKKLTQTVLNFKKKSLEMATDFTRKSDDLENREKNIWPQQQKRVGDAEDDFIIASPGRVNLRLQNSRKQSSEHELIRIRNYFSSIPHVADLDLDETFVSPSVVRNLANNHKMEKEIIEPSPLKRPALERRPEDDSVPFVYEREPVRKKAERMKLPGHACNECKKYYKLALGDVDNKDLKFVLNQCSRHRDKNAPNLNDTPPGYWKPFLTCTSAQK